MKLVLTAVLLLACGLSFGCGPNVPYGVTWRPWSRALGSANQLMPGSAVSINIDGATEPLLGTEALLQDEIESVLYELLTRRGYVVQDSAKFHFEVAYSTESVEKLEFSRSTLMSQSSNLASGSVSGTAVSGGWGVALAATLTSIASASSSVTSESGGSYTAYRHIISISAKSHDGDEIWKVDSRWDSHSVDILDQIIPALQSLLSSLPSTGDYVPEVSAVRASHADNYIELVCADRSFGCPALPSPITFGTRVNGEYYWNEDVVKDVCAFDAYVDLIQTAEYAVPRGKDDWRDPLDEFLWAKAQIGAKYKLMPEGKEIYVLVDLEGDGPYYRITECYTVSADYFSQFERDRDSWIAGLERYFDVYGLCE